MEALDFKKAREALKKFTNDGTNPLLRQIPNRPIPGVESGTVLKPNIVKSLSAPTELKSPALESKPRQASLPAEVSGELESTARKDGREEEDVRINFKAARETLQKLTSLNNGMFFMTDRKSRQAF